MVAFKSAYLIHGDDHGRIAERRATLRALAESESGVGGVEVLDGETGSPEDVAAALSAMTFSMGRRFVIVDGAERFKDADVEQHLVPALTDLPEDTTVAFFGREESRAKVPANLAKAVAAAEGVVAEEQTLKAKELPKWLQGEAKRLGLQLDRSGAQALIARTGERQQRLLRELEKLLLEHGTGTRIGEEELDGTALSSEKQVWGLVDALAAGKGAAATRALLELQAQGEAINRLAPLMARRVRDVLTIALRLEAGESPSQIKASTKGNPWAVDRRISEARGADVDRLRLTLEALADLELATHGGSMLSDRTEALRAIVKPAA